MRVIVFWGVLVAAANAALLVLVELEAIVPRSFVILLYCVVVAAVSHSRTTFLLVAAEARDSKRPSNCLMMVMAGTLRLVTVVATEWEKVVMLWIALTVAAVQKVSPHLVSALVSRLSARWKGPDKVCRPFVPCLIRGRFAVPPQVILWEGVSSKE